MTPAEVIARLEAAGVKVRVDEKMVIHAGPSDRLTDELRALIRANKAALVEALTAVKQPEPAHAHDGGETRQPEAPVPAPERAAECMRCANLTMRIEHHVGTRRVFWWRCNRGHALMEGRNFGERVLLAPPECADFEQWKAGQR